MQRADRSTAPYFEDRSRQYTIGPASDGQPRPALAIADYGLHPAVKIAVACERAGIDQSLGLHLSIVLERANPTWGTVRSSGSS